MAEHIAERVRLTEAQKVAQPAPPDGKQPKERGINAAVRGPMLTVPKHNAQARLSACRSEPGRQHSEAIFHAN
jgi:hypothetical protein